MRSRRLPLPAGSDFPQPYLIRSPGFPVFHSEGSLPVCGAQIGSNFGGAKMAKMNDLRSALEFLKTKEGQYIVDFAIRMLWSPLIPDTMAP